MKNTHYLKPKDKPKLTESPLKIKRAFIIFDGAPNPCIECHMSNRILSIIDSGLEGILVEVECHITNGLPAIVIVGYGNKSIDEARERLRGAFSRTGLELPRKRITINLAPADIPKGGSGFDLAIAMAILLSSTDESVDITQSIFIGELGLDGSLRPVRGIIGKILAARKLGFTQFFIPAANQQQAQLVPGIKLYAGRTLQEIYEHCIGLSPLLPQKNGGAVIPRDQLLTEDFSQIVGQARAKRCLEIAAAGGHNVLLQGPPGTGKSLLARTLRSILPPLQTADLLDITHLHSLVGANFNRIIAERPFRAPHHSSSSVAIIGGGQTVSPGEISLSHHGVLFLDEFPEFNRAVIEGLRQPMEDHKIIINRGKQSALYPADFILVATANPCPCGFYGSDHDCHCPPHLLKRYQLRLSGPVMDRIDLKTYVTSTPHGAMMGAVASESSQVIRSRVIDARQRQSGRQGPGLLNSRLSSAAIKQFSSLSDQAEQLANQAADQLKLSTRAYLSTLKVGRTIADLAQSTVVAPEHITEALQYRSL